MRNAAKAEAGGTDWARQIVRRYEAGGKVPPPSLRAAMTVLGIKPGTLLRGGCNPANDRLAQAAQANDFSDNDGGCAA
jgi:hypothetical protein